jgi:hypothetical protein
MADEISSGLRVTFGPILSGPTHIPSRGAEKAPDDTPVGALSARFARATRNRAKSKYLECILIVKVGQFLRDAR